MWKVSQFTVAKKPRRPWPAHARARVQHPFGALPDDPPGRMGLGPGRPGSAGGRSAGHSPRDRFARGVPRILVGRQVDEGVRTSGIHFERTRRKPKQHLSACSR